MGVPIYDDGSDDGRVRLGTDACAKFLRTGRTCTCKCRHGLRWLVRAKTHDPKHTDSPGVEEFGDTSLARATRMAKCRCCDAHQSKRPTVDEVRALFEHWGATAPQ